MDVTWTIRYQGPSHQEARVLQQMLERQGVHVEPPPPVRDRWRELAERQQRERRELVQRQRREQAELEAEQEQERRELVERQRQERAEQSAALLAVAGVNQVVINLVSTGRAVAIAAAVKKFRNLAPGGKVEVEGEGGAQDSG